MEELATLPLTVLTNKALYPESKLAYAVIYPDDPTKKIKMSHVELLEAIGLLPLREQEALTLFTKIIEDLKSENLLTDEKIRDIFRDTN